MKYQKNKGFRTNVCFSAEAWEIITIVRKSHPDINISGLISELIVQKLEDPRNLLKKQLKEHAIAINEIQTKLADLDKIAPEMQE